MENSATLKKLSLAFCLTAIFATNTYATDITKPVLAQVKAIPAKGKDTTPNYTFSSDEAGTILYGGACSSNQTTAIAGNNTITLKPLAFGTYSNCTIRVRDAEWNTSTILAIPTFKINHPLPPVGANPKLNDTGVTLCGDYAYDNSLIHQNNLDCAATGAGKAVAGVDADGDPVPAGQDAFYGRDANLATNSNADGVAGFSFTKLGADGNALAIQNASYSETGSEANGTHWSCVLDNVTGLVWEIKTDDGGLRDKDWTYTWYNPDKTNNGGSVGSLGFASTCNGLNHARCNTKKFVSVVNTVGLCGANDWRLPTMQELMSIVLYDRIYPAIDTNYFPNPSDNLSNYLTSSVYISSSLDISTDVRIVTLGHGFSGYADKKTKNHVRLVRNNL